MRQHLRVAVLAGGFLAILSCTARADDKASVAAAPAAPAVAAAPAQQFCTVYVKEMVPETYTTTVTKYRQETREETYTAYRTEVVPETRTITKTIYEKVPEMRTEIRKCWETVPVVENRVICEKKWICVPETKVIRKCVDKGHWECREVPCGPSLCDRLRKCFHRCNPCDSCCEPCCEPVRTKTVKCWVPCPVWEEKCVTVNVKKCITEQRTCQVTVCKKVCKEVPVQVCCYKCVPKCVTETVTVCCKKCVPVQCKRCVTVCVPYCETVNCTRMVCKCVAKQVPVCPASCCETVTCCKPKCGHHFLGRLLSRCHSGCGDCSSCCN